MKQYQTVRDKQEIKTKEGYFEMYNDDGILYMYKQFDDHILLFKFDENEQKENIISLLYNEIEFLYGLTIDATK